jgi:hypothetical protein
MKWFRKWLCRIGWHAPYYADVCGSGAFASGEYCEHCDIALDCYGAPANKPSLGEAIDNSVREVRAIREQPYER